MPLPRAEQFAFANAFPERDALSGIRRHQLIEAVNLGTECMTMELGGVGEETIKAHYRNGILRIEADNLPVPALAAE